MQTTSGRIDITHNRVTVEERFGAGSVIQAEYTRDSATQLWSLRIRSAHNGEDVEQRQWKYMATLKTADMRDVIRRVSAEFAETTI